jgi:hypothetical protein
MKVADYGMRFANHNNVQFALQKIKVAQKAFQKFKNKEHVNLPEQVIAPIQEAILIIESKNVVKKRAGASAQIARQGANVARGFGAYHYVDGLKQAVQLMNEYESFYRRYDYGMTEILIAHSIHDLEEYLRENWTNMIQNIAPSSDISELPSSLMAASFSASTSSSVSSPASASSPASSSSSAAASTTTQTSLSSVDDLAAAAAQVTSQLGALKLNSASMSFQSLLQAEPEMLGQLFQEFLRSRQMPAAAPAPALTASSAAVQPSAVSKLNN